MKNEFIIKTLDEYIPNPKCTLDYNKDYELLIATVLSAQCTDERVNKITKILWDKYDIYSLSKANIDDIKSIIYPLGNSNKKSVYISEIAKSLVDNYDGKVPNDKAYLLSLPGVGEKVTNVFLANYYKIPSIAVDTHVLRVSKRLGLAKDTDKPIDVERKLEKVFPKDRWIDLHHELLLFGRYYCTARNPKCSNCKFNKICKYYKEVNR